MLSPACVDKIVLLLPSIILFPLKALQRYSQALKYRPAEVVLNGSRCGRREPSPGAGSMGAAFGAPGEHRLLLRDAGGGTTDGWNGVILYTSQAFVESARLAPEIEKVQLSENTPGNAQKGSWHFKMFARDSGTTILLVTFPSKKHNAIGEVSKLKESRFLHSTMETGRFSQIWKCTW